MKIILGIAFHFTLAIKNFEENLGSFFREAKHFIKFLLI
jgi:hypothetical protein